jgi:two-component system chemotaxis sensor kinase CheA
MTAARDPYKYFRIEARELLDGLGQGVLVLEKGGGPQGETVARLLRLAHTLKGASRVVKLGEIAERAHAIEGILAPYRATPSPLAAAHAERLLALLDEIGSRVAAIDVAADDGKRPPAAPAAVVAEAPFETVRVELEEMDDLLEAVSETAVQVRGVQGETARLERSQQLADLLVEHLNPRRAGASAARAHGFAVELRESLARAGRSLTAGIERAAGELVQVREAANRLRLLPAESIFPQLERAARDAARATGRTFDFHARGGSVRLDAHVLAALRDALLHVVRNAVAHGIELPAERLAAGKPPAGRVEVVVERRGTNVAFVCRDDGRGIDVQALGEAAVREGWLAASASSELSPHEAFRLLLKGGLTTTRTLTEVSGRGIGLDVVRTTAERLKGEVSVKSEPGRGAAFEIVVPVSLSSVPALVVEAADVVAALPLDAVRMTVRLPDADIARSSGNESIVHEGTVIPFVPLARALGRTGHGGAARRTWSAVIVESGARRAAIGVDRLRGTGHAVMRPLPAHADAHAVVTGASLDVEGNPQLVLDAAGLLSVAHTPHAGDADVPAPKAPVLVIDDSLTTRMLEQSILEAAGYEVDVATSAEEGLVKAKARRYGVCLVDVEMPGMDGFQFVTEMRADPVLRQMPCILVTSRSAPEDRQRGHAAGAHAYVVKGEFDQAFVLRTLRELMG